MLAQELAQELHHYQDYQDLLMPTTPKQEGCTPSPPHASSTGGLIVRCGISIKQPWADLIAPGKKEFEF